MNRSDQCLLEGGKWRGGIWGGGCLSWNRINLCTWCQRLSLLEHMQRSNAVRHGVTFRLGTQSTKPAHGGAESQKSPSNTKSKIDCDRWRGSEWRKAPTAEDESKATAENIHPDVIVLARRRGDFDAATVCGRETSPLR